MARNPDGSLSVPVPQDRIRATYDRVAGIYAKTIARLEAPSQRRVLDRLHLGPGATVVDVGCGPGRALSALADRVGPSGSVLGVDAAPAMVDEARSRVRASGYADRASVVLGDARRLPLAGGSVDAVCALDVLDLFCRSDLDVVLGECRRVLAPEGRLCLVTMDRGDVPDSAFLRWYEWAYAHVPGFATVGCRPIPAVQSVRDAGFEVQVQIKQRRAGVWPVTGLVCCPE